MQKSRILLGVAVAALALAAGLASAMTVSASEMPRDAYPAVSAQASAGSHDAVPATTVQAQAEKAAGVTKLTAVAAKQAPRTERVAQHAGCGQREPHPAMAKKGGKGKGGGGKKCVDLALHSAPPNRFTGST